MRLAPTKATRGRYPMVGYHVLTGVEEVTLL